MHSSHGRLGRESRWFAVGAYDCAAGEIRTQRRQVDLGGEAAAVVPEGRANPHQTLATAENRAGLAALVGALNEAHQECFHDTSDLWVGLQLTHSGRFCQPAKDRPRPRIAYHHPLLDAKFGIDPQNRAVVISDAEVERLVDAYVAAAGVALEAGFDFVDIKACHGYLLHEFLSARTRPGPYGGDFDGRTRLLTTIIDARAQNIRAWLWGFG